MYFLMDTGTPKYGHRIEDAEHRAFYEAKMTKFTLLTPFGFDFIDRERGVTPPPDRPYGERRMGHIAD